MAPRPRSAVVHQPRTGLALQRGFRRVTALLRPTIGPLPRTVAIASLGNRAPELLDDGGLIARRLLQLGDRDEDAGAMFLRGLLWRVHQSVGDGVATTSVLFQSIYDGGLSAIAAGSNATRLRQHLHDGLVIILDELTRLTLPVDSQTRLTRIALTVCSEPALAQHLGELAWVLGEHWQLELRSGQTRGLLSEAIEGSYWETPVLSTIMLSESHARRVELERPVILISDLELDQPRDLIQLLTLARGAGAGSLVVIARKLTEPCNAVLMANNGPGFRTIGGRTPGIGPPDRHAASLHDLTALTGGRPFRLQAGDSLRHVQLADLGRARRAWVDRQHVGIIGPAGDPHRLRDHVRDLRRLHHGSKEAEVRAELSQRLGRLSGASAMLWVDGATTEVIDSRKALIRRTVAALRSALQDGALPGGGAAFLACRSRIRARLASALAPEEKAAYQILLRALAEPTRAILANSGHDDGWFLAELDQAASGYGLNAETGQIVDVEAAGILDSAAVVRMAIRAAVEGAAQALTIDTLVHPRHPEEAMTP